MIVSMHELLTVAKIIFGTRRPTGTQMRNYDLTRPNHRIRGRKRTHKRVQKRRRHGRRRSRANPKKN